MKPDNSWRFRWGFGSWAVMIIPAILFVPTLVGANWTVIVALGGMAALLIYPISLCRELEVNFGRNGGEILLKRFWFGKWWSQQRYPSGNVSRIIVGKDFEGPFIKVRFWDGTQWNLPSGIEEELPELLAALEAMEGSPVNVATEKYR